MSKFKVGDKVFHVGNGVGEVVKIDNSNTEYAMAVKFEGTGPGFFCSDGRYHIHHNVPQIYTLEEARKMGFDVPKEKVKKKIEKWVNVYLDGISPFVYDTENGAKNNIDIEDEHIDCVKLTGEYEVEE